MTNNVKLNASKRRKIASLDRRKARAGWFFVLPFLIGFALIYLPMVWQSIEISFSKIVIGGASGTYDLVGVGFIGRHFVDKFVIIISYGISEIRGRSARI